MLTAGEPMAYKLRPPQVQVLAHKYLDRLRLYAQ
jgi:hypothetical protein